jgi:hypothetical protein
MVLAVLAGKSDMRTELEPFTNLSLEAPQPTKPSRVARKAQQVAESWEDEEVSGDERDQPISSQNPSDYPAAPPPTPSSPTSHSAREPFVNPYGYDANEPASTRNRQTVSRPDKTDAVAKRIIAGALGIKPPKRTEEQKAYDKAIREKEIKRRNMEKEEAAKAMEETARAKAAVWDD